jgi:hypothetical protein
LQLFAYTLASTNLSVVPGSPALQAYRNLQWKAGRGAQQQLQANAALEQTGHIRQKVFPHDLR